ncbi:MAG: hypothetical protein Q7J04_09200, partial [Microcella sp.]|nr:hypothetical protein [Microcella sp.]
LAGAGPFELLLGVITTVVSVGIAMAFWVTVVFAIIERTGGGDRASTSWSPDSLPASTPHRQVGIGDLVGGVLGLVLLVAGLVAQSALSPIRADDGVPIPILAPELWAWWIPFLIAIVVIELAFVIVLYRHRTWSWGLAVGNTVVNVAAAVPLIVLVLTDSVVNPEFSARLADLPELIDAGPQLAVGVAVVIGAVSLWDSVDGLRKAAQASR